MRGPLIGRQFAFVMFALMFALISALMVGGCGVSSVSNMSGAAGIESRRGVSEQAQALEARAPEGSSSARMTGAADRLAMEVGRAIDRSHWGRLHVKSYVAANEPGDETGREDALVVVHAQALVPGSRTAQVIAWAVDDGEIVASVRVGYFGDAQAEAAYLEQLRTLLEGKPPAGRDWKFRLPANLFGLGSRDRDNGAAAKDKNLDSY